MKVLWVTVVIQGVPPNWSQWRGSSLRRDLAKKVWRDQAWLLAQDARNRARWGLPIDDRGVPSPRFLEIRVRKAHPLMDEDGVVAALKPIIDGLKGPLLVDDSPRWCSIVTPPCEMQERVTSRHQEGVDITVHLEDPRPSYSRTRAAP